MLSDVGLIQLCDDLHIRMSGQRIIQNIRSSGPARRVQSRFGKVATDFASVKMGRTLQAQDQFGFAFVLTAEHDDTCYEIYDQPPDINLSYPSPSGRMASFQFKPDFFTIADDFCGWIALWPAEKIEKSAIHHATRFVKTDNGKWRDLAGETYAAQHGLGFRIVTSRDFDSILLRNTAFLADYMRKDELLLNESAVDDLLTFISEEPGEYLSEILEGLPNVTTDVIFSLLVQQRIYIDVTTAPLSEPTLVRCFLHQQQAKMFAIVEVGSIEAAYPRPTLIRRETGEEVNWDGRSWTIKNIGETEITLVDGQINKIELPHLLFDRLVREGKIQGFSLDGQDVLMTEGQALLRQATPRAEDDLIKRAHILEIADKQAQGIPLTIQEEQDVSSVSSRTISRWRARKRDAGFKYGNPQFGLLSLRHQQGNAHPRYDEGYLNALLDFLRKFYFVGEQPTIHASWLMWNDECENVTGRSKMGRKTFTKLIREFKTYENQHNREGHRGAYTDRPTALFFWYLDVWMPPHGEYPLHIAHIDHTQLDIELRDSRTGANLGKPWLTLMTCARTRRILALYLTFDTPSYRSIMMVIRSCVKRFGRIPTVIVADGGKDFHSHYFSSLLARYGSSLRTRPPAEARAGNVLERLFGTTNTQLIHQLMGNTKVMKKELRKVTKAIDPREIARWTIGLLVGALCEWAFEVYDNRIHSTLKESPRNAFARGERQSGKREHLTIAVDEDFLRDTLPSTEKGTARIQSNKGIKVNNAYYANPILKRPAFAGLDVPVKYDPWNYGVIYVYISRTKEGKESIDRREVIGWIECRSSYYNDFYGLTERQVMLLSEEVRRLEKLQNREIPDYVLARFLRRMKDIEARLDGEWKARWALEAKQTIENDDVITYIMGDHTAAGGRNTSDDGEGTSSSPDQIQDVDTPVASENDVTLWNQEEGDEIYEEGHGLY